MSTTLQHVLEVVHAELCQAYFDRPLYQLQDLLVLGLTEEAGEVAGLRKRNLRNNARDIGRGGRDEYVDELGDVLWYLVACCDAFGISLDEIWEMNRRKLEERYGRTECEGQCEFPGALYGGDN